MGQPIQGAFIPTSAATRTGGKSSGWVVAAWTVAALPMPPEGEEVFKMLATNYVNRLGKLACPEQPPFGEKLLKGQLVT